MKLKKLLEYDFIIDFQKVLVTNFEKELFIGSLRNYCSHGNPLRFHNFAFSMRELVLSIIERRAPNDKVKATSWYQVESDNFEVTRRQKLKFCAQGFLSDDFFDEYSLEDLNLTISEYLGKFRFFNKYTHINEKSFKPCPKKFFEDMKNIIQLSKNVIDELSSIEELVISAVESNLEPTVFEAVVNNFPDDLSILAENVIIEQTSPEELNISTINDRFISIYVDGTVYVSQEYGGSEDFTSLPSNYPFSIEIYVSVNNPNDITVDVNNINVDTSSWYE
ncbi:hypothetical protein I4674_10640 [Proteus mirabilis]|nr:hypothetical protein [Proteus mirabilis]